MRADQMKKKGHIKYKLKEIRHFFEYIGALIVYHSIRGLPHCFIVALSNFAGQLLILLPNVRKLIQSNLRIAFPEKENWEIRKLARKNAISTILALCDFFWFIDRDEKIAKYIDFSSDSKKISDKYTNDGKGLLWITPHLGNWELAAFKFYQSTDIPYLIVAKKHKNPFLDKMIFSGRKSEGVLLIPPEGAIKKMIKALRNGSFSAMLIDQNTRVRDGGVFVDFFGLPVSVSRTPALFARRLGVPVAVGGCIRKGNRYETFSAELSKLPSEYADDQELIQDIMNIIEGFIKEHPEQYLWLYKIWKYSQTHFEGEKDYPNYTEKATPRFYSNSAPKDKK